MSEVFDMIVLGSSFLEQMWRLTDLVGHRRDQEHLIPGGGFPLQRARREAPPNTTAGKIAPILSGGTSEVCGADKPTIGRSQWRRQEQRGGGLFDVETPCAIRERSGQRSRNDVAVTECLQSIRGWEHGQGYPRSPNTQRMSLTL